MVVGNNALSPRTPRRSKSVESCFPDKIFFAVIVAALRETSSLLFGCGLAELHSNPVESCFSDKIFFAVFAALRETSLLFFGCGLAELRTSASQMENAHRGGRRGSRRPERYEQHKNLPLPNRS